MNKTTFLDIREGGEPIVLCKLENGRLVDNKLMLLAIDTRGIERSVQVCSKGLNAFTLGRLRENGLYDVERKALELIDEDYAAVPFQAMKEKEIVSVNSDSGYEGMLFFGNRYNPLSLKQVRGSYLSKNLELSDELGFLQGYDFSDLRRYLDVRRRFENELKRDKRFRRAA